MLEVRNGVSRADALDALIPTSGGPHAITVKQMNELRPILPAVLLGGVMNLLAKRNIARRATGTAPPANPPPSTSTKEG